MSETQQLISGALTVGGMGGMPHDDRFFLGLAVLALVYGLLCAAIGAVIAHVKNQSVREGFLLGAFLGILGLIAVARLPRKPKTQTPSGVTQPGWCPDPAGIGPSKYWDGQAWSDRPPQ
jgi:hypothetical protein